MASRRQRLQGFLRFIGKMMQIAPQRTQVLQIKDFIPVLSILKTSCKKLNLFVYF